MEESFNHYQPPTISISFDIEKKYHVFLSFRGPDVREGLVKHLYTDLCKAGLSVFLDSEDLEKGEEIDPALETAIDNSDIHIPIFSKGYAGSTWCLREAARMCTRALIIPLFYKVEPYHVRYPEKEGSPYAEAFKKLYDHLDRHPKTTIYQWKEALYDICKKSGWFLKEGSGSETTLVETVVRDVLNTVRNVPFPVGELPTGLQKDKHELVQKLNLEVSDRVMRIGICGGRGVGKTTIAKAVYNEIHRKFDACSFVFNVRISAKNKNTRLMELQTRILKDIVQYPEEVPSVDHGKSLMRDRLRGRRALVILDDVDHKKQLDALAGDWFGPGSRVIIISRDQNIWDLAKVDSIHSVSRLTEASPLVFAHYMLYYPETIDVLKEEIQLAASRGIDAFALNSNVWREDRAEAIYEAARQASPSGSFRLFFSADMHKDKEGSLSPDDLVTMLTRYRNHPNQLIYKGKQFFSAWLGDEDACWKEYIYPTALAGWKEVFDKAGGLDDFFFVPFFPTDGSPMGVGDMIGRFRDVIDGLFAWDTSAWPYFAPDMQNPSNSKDRVYMNACTTKDKVYMASVSPWFFSGCQVKGNYQGPGLWINKWKHLIDLKPHFVQILTWNNWWDSSYVAPPFSEAADDDVAEFEHRAFLELGQHFIKWYKDGKEPDVMEERLYMFYYTHSKSLNAEDCGESHIDQLSDELYVTVMLTEPATLELRSGDAYQTFNAEAGMSTWSMNFHEGRQAAFVRRGSCVVKSVEGKKKISNSKVSKCNFNVYSAYA